MPVLLADEHREVPSLRVWPVIQIILDWVAIVGLVYIGVVCFAEALGMFLERTTNYHLGWTLSWMSKQDPAFGLWLAFSLTFAGAFVLGNAFFHIVEYTGVTKGGQ